jgi:hypothetical protein
MNDQVYGAVIAFASSGLVASLTGVLLSRHRKEIELAVTSAAARRDHDYLVVRKAKERMLCELVGPVILNLKRVHRAYLRYDGNNEFLEGEIMAKCATNIREIISERGYLLDAAGLQHAVDLVEHFDVWLEEFDRQRGTGGKGDPYVFAGARGHPFPRAAEEAFHRMWVDLKRDLYGDLSIKYIHIGQSEQS